MTVHQGELTASEARTADEAIAGLAFFDQIRGLLVGTGLPAEPEVYDLFWRYVRDESHALSLAVDTAIALGELDLAVVIKLRRVHCGELGRAAVAALVETAQTQAEALSHRIEAGRNDLADYGRTIADGGARLGAPLDAAALGALLDELGTATANMQAANARLEAALVAAAAEARALTEQLGAAERAAITDPLTGVLNRRGAFALLERSRAKSREEGTDLAVAMLDIDHFKYFNDRFGHALGDEVLRFVAGHVADRLKTRGGTVGRMGGEEFVAIVPGHDVMGASAIVDRIRAELAAQIIRNTSDGSSMGRVTFSAGVAGNRADDTSDTLVERADKALYSAKRMGRDRIVPDRS